MLYSNNNKKYIKVQEGKYKPEPWDTVKCIEQGKNYIDIIAMEKPVKTHVKRIDEDHYMVLSTGEVREYQEHEEKKQRDYFVLQRTFNRLRRLLRTNFEGGENELFMTLTYRENMQEPKELYKDFDKFLKKLKYHYAKYELEYIAVAEPQGRGAWHFHITMKCQEGEALWFPQSKLLKLWGHGGVCLERLKSGDIGSYYVAYFTDLLQGIKDSHDEKHSAEKKSNARKKGERLHFYPKNFKFYRCSRGIKEPEETEILMHGIDEEYECTYSHATNVCSVQDGENGEEEVEVLNRIYKAVYKRKSKKKDELT